MKGQLFTSSFISFRAHLLGPQVKVEGVKKNSRGDINEQCKINMKGLLLLQYIYQASPVWPNLLWKNAESLREILKIYCFQYEQVLSKVISILFIVLVTFSVKIHGTSFLNVKKNKAITQYWCFEFGYSLIRKTIQQHKNL